MKKSAKKSSRSRPKMSRASEDMKRMAALLEAELLTWRNVSARPMFGMNGLYRGPRIFAALPRTRTLHTPNSIAFRLLKRSSNITKRMKNDQRVIMPTPEAKWISFVVESETDIHDALQWLVHAYDEAGKN